MNGKHSITWPLMICLVVSWLGTGCSVRYYNPESSTEHFIGFNVVSITYDGDPQDGQAIATGAKTVGVNIAASPWDAGFTVGYRETDLASLSTAGKGATGRKIRGIWHFDIPTENNSELDPPHE